MTRLTMGLVLASAVLTWGAPLHAGRFDLNLPPATSPPAAPVAPKSAPVAKRAPARAKQAPAHVDAAPAVFPAVAGDPDATWSRLLEGNARFVAGRPSRAGAEARGLPDGDPAPPAAVVLSCVDDPLAPEVLFDQPVGGLFVVRTAGAVVDETEAGAVEFAVERLGARVIVVLGHERCEALAAALAGATAATPAQAAIVSRMRPALANLTEVPLDEARGARAVELNARRAAASLASGSSALSARVEAGEVLVVCASHAPKDGRVRELARGASPDAPGSAAATVVADAAPAGPAQAPAATAALAVASPAVAIAPARPAVATPAVTPAAGPPIAWDGQLRYRYEARSVLDYRRPGTFKRAAGSLLAEGGDASVMRMRVGAGVPLARAVRGYFSLQDARTMGAEGSPGGTLDNVDLYLAYVDVDSLLGRPLSIRTGRQVLAYGDGHLVWGADWGNTGRAYDGVRARWSPPRLQLDGFVTWISEGTVAGHDRLLSGVDALWKPRPGLELEGYHFARSFGDTAFAGENGRGGRVYDGSSGAAAKGRLGRFELRGEGALQRGHRAGDDVRAWFAVGSLAFELPRWWKARVVLERTETSGDRLPGDGTTQRFDPIYWGGHSFLGTLDVSGAANLRAWSAGLTLRPERRWTLAGDVHRFGLAEATDAWANDAGTTQRRDPTGAAGTDLGRELDLSARFEPRPRLVLLTGWSHLWPGAYVERTGGAPALDWGFLQMSVGF